MVLKKLILSVICLSVSLMADPVMVNLKVSTGAYKNESHLQSENPFFYVNVNEQVQTLQSRGSQFKIQNKAQQVGWISNEKCNTIVPSKSLSFDFASVKGYDDNPEVITLFGAQNDDVSEIALNRSFRTEIMQNIDKETISRILE
jgi:hypothetical protein